MSSDDLALYVHIPYCRRRCSYCDFNAHAPAGGVNDGLFSSYAQALIQDIAAQDGQSLSTIFWGGGTPSLMPVEYLAQIVDALRNKFDWQEGLENTIEANPGTLSVTQFEAYLKLGFNRLSMGAQAFQPELLEMVGRIHSAEQIEECFRDARGAGFDNISLDLIYGFPGQTVAQWRESLERVLALDPEHISVYQLMVEPSTRLEMQLSKGELELPPEDDMIAMDDLAEELLTDSAFGRYEISNWAKSGRECQHNLKYWTDSEYLGLGCGAVSFLKGWRIERIKAPSYYERAIQSGRSPVVFAERRGSDGALKDHLMMALRVQGGVSWQDLEKRYSGLDRQQLRDFLSDLPQAWWEESARGFRLTRKGWDFHSEVVMALMDVMFSFS